MDEVLLSWLFLIGILLWRGITSFRPIQRCLHVAKYGGFLFQWYTLTFIGIAVLLGRTVYDIVYFDWLKYDFLSPKEIQSNLDDLRVSQHVSDQEIKDYEMFPWLKLLALFAPIFGVLAFVVVVNRVWRLALFNANHRKDGLFWSLSSRVDMVLLMLGTPLVFIVMSMRALIRIWAVMTASAWQPYHGGGSGMNVTWEFLKGLELATYSMDLELAGTFQFYAIWMFGKLCGSLLSNSKHFNNNFQNEAKAKQYKRTIKWAAFQGVYAYVVVGVCRSLFDFALAILQESNAYTDLCHTLETTVAVKIGTIFTFLTLLCIINMGLILSMTDITDVLGRAGLKFIGVRILLLITQVQPQLFAALTRDSVTHTSVMNFAKDHNLEATFLKFEISSYQAMLLHVTLLHFECFLAVIYNSRAWNLGEEQFMRLMDEEGSAELKEPLTKGPQ